MAPLPDEQLNKIYLSYDDDKSGLLNEEELRKLVLNEEIFQDLTSPEIEEVMKEARFDDKGEISFADFKILVKDVKG